MRTASFVLLCLACAGHGHGLESTEWQSQSDRPTEVTNPSNALASLLLLALRNPAARSGYVVPNIPVVNVVQSAARVQVPSRTAVDIFPSEASYSFPTTNVLAAKERKLDPSDPDYIRPGQSKTNAQLELEAFEKGVSVEDIISGKVKEDAPVVGLAAEAIKPSSGGNPNDVDFLGRPKFSGYVKRQYKISPEEVMKATR
mmetsp:Transcript_102389/g.187612  ORF Transcript_102389/g.187612 Transcript_102389/m.187612 type:complete len:200 (+) Transcript_102389:55-654(+)